MKKLTKYQSDKAPHYTALDFLLKANNRQLRRLSQNAIPFISS